MPMPNSTLRIVATTVALAAMAMAGCAAQPSYDDDTYAQSPCRGDQKLKCTKRSAQPEECSCVTTGDVEELIESVINRIP